MRTLCTGSSGLIGLPLCRRLLNKKDTIYGISLKSDSAKGVMNYNLDLTDYEDVKVIIKGISPHVVYHCAANPEENLTNTGIDNLHMFLNVLICAIESKSLKHFNFISSVAVGVTPRSLYAKNKLLCEEILKKASVKHGFTYTIYRPHTVYGPNGNNIVKTFITNISNDIPCILYNKGKMRRYFTYVEDLCKVLKENYINETVTVGSQYETTIIELLAFIELVLNKKAVITVKGKRQREIESYDGYDNLLLTEIPLMAGIKRTWEAMQ